MVQVASLVVRGHGGRCGVGPARRFLLNGTCGALGQMASCGWDDIVYICMWVFIAVMEKRSRMIVHVLVSVFVLYCDFHGIYKLSSKYLL